MHLHFEKNWPYRRHSFTTQPLRNQQQAVLQRCEAQRNAFADVLRCISCIDARERIAKLAKRHSRASLVFHQLSQRLAGDRLIAFKCKPAHLDRRGIRRKRGRGGRLGDDRPTRLRRGLRGARLLQQATSVWRLLGEAQGGQQQRWREGGAETQGDESCCAWCDCGVIKPLSHSTRWMN